MNFSEPTFRAPSSTPDRVNLHSSEEWRSGSGERGGGARGHGCGSEANTDRHNGYVTQRNGESSTYEMEVAEALPQHGVDGKEVNISSRTGGGGSSAATGCGRQGSERPTNEELRF